MHFHCEQSTCPNQCTLEAQKWLRRYRSHRSWTNQQNWRVKIDHPCLAASSNISPCHSLVGSLTGHFFEPLVQALRCLCCLGSSIHKWVYTKTSLALKSIARALSRGRPGRPGRKPFLETWADPSPVPPSKWNALRAEYVGINHISAIGNTTYHNIICIYIILCLHMIAQGL